MRRLQRRRGDILIDLHELNEVSVEPLRTGAADILVGYLPVTTESSGRAGGDADSDGGDDMGDIASLSVATVYPFLVMPRGHRLARKARIQVADFAGDPFVAYHEDQVPYQLQLKALAAHGVRPTRVITTSSADSILGFVESGLGFSLVPSLSPTGPRGRGIVARPLLSPRVEFPVVAAWRRDAPDNPLLEAALECAPGRD